jgi:predicted DNA binding protein
MEEENKSKETKFHESVYKKNIDGKRDDVDVLEQVQKMDAYDDIIDKVPEEDHDKLFEAVDAIAGDWQVIADMIQEVYSSPENIAEFKKMAIDKFGNKQS